MRRHVILEKQIGQTPLEALQEWKHLHPSYVGVPASYAGRLDPMASGKLLVLLGEECKRQAHYTALDKEYEVKVLLDVGSDTGDVLGIVKGTEEVTAPAKSILRETLQSFIGSRDVPYPAFSSKTVAGKPLFLYALEGTLGTISIPTHTEKVYSIQLKDVTSLPTHILKSRIESLLAKAPTSTEPSKELGADFRIVPVKESWKELLAQEERSYTILTLRVVCASGTYMRTLANDLGKALGTRALALSIHRSRIGKRPFWLL